VGVDLAPRAVDLDLRALEPELRSAPARLVWGASRLAAPGAVALVVTYSQVTGPSVVPL
jgi:hypothetical protein